MRYIDIVRLAVFTFAAVAALAAPALACPPIDACLANLHSTVHPSLGPAATVPPITSLALALRMPPAPRSAEPVQLPWFWHALRDRVYSKMPTYRDSKDITVVLAPVVVTSPSDTVPGLGIAGDF